MSTYGLIFSSIICIAILVMQRNRLPLLLMASALYVPLGDNLQIGPGNFSAMRLAILACLVRYVMRGELRGTRFNKIDSAILVFSIWVSIASLTHTAFGFTIVPVSGYMFATFGMYFCLKNCVLSIEDVSRLMKGLVILTIPVAVLMIVEISIGRNVIYGLSGFSTAVLSRGDHLRATAAFRHPILAGTVGAAIALQSLSLIGVSGRLAFVGILIGLAMVIASASSGPILALCAGIVFLLLWRYRHKFRTLGWSILLFYILCEIVMSKPAYFLIARIDIVGGSTGWHRAELIRVALSKFSTWWLFGTEYTRDWMASGVSWSENQSDITNYFLYWTVLGGLAPLLCMIYIVFKSFKILHAKSYLPELHHSEQYLLWGVASVLFCHVVTSFSVAYFDHSLAFFWLPIAIASSINDRLSSKSA